MQTVCVCRGAERNPAAAALSLRPAGIIHVKLMQSSLDTPPVGPAALAGGTDERNTLVSSAHLFEKPSSFYLR